MPHTKLFIVYIYMYIHIYINLSETNKSSCLNFIMITNARCFSIYKFCFRLVHIFASTYISILYIGRIPFIEMCIIYPYSLSRICKLFGKLQNYVFLGICAREQPKLFITFMVITIQKQFSCFLLLLSRRR